MYTILVALGVAVITGAVWTALGLWKTWAFGAILGITVAVVVFIVQSRRTAKKIEPVFEQVQRQVQQGNSKLALTTLEELLPMGKWQILLTGQLYAQMGSLCFTMGDDKRALDYLQKASPRVADGQLFLASLLHRRKQGDEAKRVLDTAIRYNKKQMMIYNVYAWMLNKEGDRAAAIEQLLRALKVESGNEATKDNLQRLQNDKKLNMKRFGMGWYSLQLEKLPASMRQGQQAMTGRRGFRQKRSKR